MCMFGYLKPPDIILSLVSSRHLDWTHTFDTHCMFEFIDSFDKLPIQCSARHSTIVVVSPLNALMRDQVSKLKGFLNVSVVKSTMLESDSNIDCAFETCEVDELFLQPPQILFAHPEELVGSKKAQRCLKFKNLQESVVAIVIDESHLVVNW